ncbi:hypothetical protein [Isoptericola sediminis]|uniref:Uncharacterized protein n=1 Tax=Isoptericola sediminis TaxID=2733572 RepID=A0A849K250_9MICO|nr:hypothetical protein [Isoptericola sediminis]NNU27278.1 hypothetical protein [Isoptericola sediminis]
MRSPLLDDLGGLDPARHVRAPGHPDDPALARVLATDRTVPDRYLAPARRSRAGVATGVFAGAVAAVAAGVVVSTTLGGPEAYASWTPTPQVVDPAAAGQDAEACPTAAHAIDEDAAGEGAPITEIPLDPVLAEVRGDYTYVLLAGDGALAECFVTTTDGDPQVYTSESVGAEQVPEPAPSGLVVAESGTASWSDGPSGEGAVTAAFGRVGDEVEAVTVATADGEQVAASVDDGWFALWAPGEESFSALAQVTYVDGSTEEVPLEVTPAG